MNKKSRFFEDVYEVVKLVPEGRVTTYGAIASYLGSKRAARMVGWAMNNSPADVPAQRVVNRVGLLSGKGHFEHPDQMEHLLNNEGIEVENNMLKNFEKHFWDPNIELEKLF